ncbi:MAG: aspartate carbamoyltransferase, partial [Thermoanaerobaculia bacterium]
LGAEVWVSGPPTFVPAGIERFGVRVSADIDEAVADADVIMMLRIQLERQGKLSFPSLREYYNTFGLTPERLARANSNAIIMHPGPMNRGVEIASDVADDPRRSVILEQVTNGVAVRMAVLYLLGGAHNE